MTHLTAVQHKAPAVALRAAIGATLAAALLVPAAPAFAAEAAASDLDEVVVTGTRVKGRTVLDSPVPIDVLSAEELRGTGALGGELGQALQSLTPSFNFPRQSNSGGADHVRAAQLRGMSPDQVLVLINGKRRHTSALVNLEAKTGKGTTPVDFNAIPFGAIKRVEVLRDGAGAQYGSDAIAGVINILLDDAAEGSTVSLGYGRHETSFEPTDQNLSDGGTTTASASTGFKLGAEGFLRIGAEYRKRAGTNRAGFDTLPFFEEQTPANQATIGQRNYKPGDGESKDTGAWFNARLPLGDNSTELYAFGTYNQRDSVGTGFFRYPDGFQNAGTQYPNGYRPESIGDSRDIGFTTGLNGTTGAWDWDGSVTYGKNAFDYGLRNSLNPSLGAASPTRFKIGQFDFRQLTANLDATREVTTSAFGGRPVNVAVGAEVRNERFQTQAGDPASYAVGPLTDKAIGAQAGPGLQPSDEAQTTRTVASLYGDVSADVTEAVTLGLAGRYEHYNDFGSTFAGKLTAVARLTDTFRLRGAVSNSFRAPSLSQVSYAATSTSFGEGGQLASVRTLPVGDPIAQALGAKELDAEKSLNFSVGFTWAPIDSFSLAVDFFQIKVKDRITISERISGPDLTAFIEDEFGVTGIDGVNFFTNAVDTKTKGADVVASWRAPVGPGTFKLTGAFSYAKTTIDKVQATPPQLAALGFNDVVFGVEERNTLVDAAPRTKGVLTAQWDTAQWALLGRVTRYGSAVRVFNFGGGFEPRQEYGAKNQLDLEVSYKPSEKVSLTLGGNNVLDEYADLSSGDINYFGNFPYDVLSPVGFNGAYFYGRVDVKF